jgi:hypothetical protein
MANAAMTEMPMVPERTVQPAPDPLDERISPLHQRLATPLRADSMHKQHANICDDDGRSRFDLAFRLAHRDLPPVGTEV